MLTKRPVTSIAKATLSKKVYSSGTGMIDLRSPSLPALTPDSSGPPTPPPGYLLPPLSRPRVVPTWVVSSPAPFNKEGESQFIIDEAIDELASDFTEEWAVFNDERVQRDPVLFSRAAKTVWNGQDDSFSNLGRPQMPGSTQSLMGESLGQSGRLDQKVNTEVSAPDPFPVLLKIHALQ